MVLIGHNPRLTTNNNLSVLCVVVGKQVGHEVMVEQMINKMQLVANIYKTLLENVEQAQKTQRKVYVARKGLQLFERFEERDTKVKMRKPGKKRNLMGSWEGLYHFVSNKDGKGCQEQDEGSIIYIIKKLDGKCWEKQEEIFTFTTHQFDESIYEDIGF